MGTILPPGLLPTPAANAMLLVGSKMKECDCEFPLAHCLLISGIIGLAMVFLESVKPTIDNLINKNNGGQDSRLEKYIRISMQILAFILILGNLAALIGGSFLVFSYYSTVSHDVKFKPNCDVEYKNAQITNWDWSRINDVNRNFEENPIYCDYGLYNFSISLMIMFWLIVGFAFGYFAWIYAGLPVDYQNSKSKE